MNIIRMAYINALLADASYAEGVRLGAIDPSTFAVGLTPTQAAFLAANFEVAALHRSSVGGFDAVVWRVRADSPLAASEPPMAGQPFVSMRGTQGWQDIADDIDLAFDGIRTHFVGKLPRAQYIKVLEVSAAHVYLTYPFVLSWSLLEAMACAAPIVASDTAPVREVIHGGENGVLVNFFDAEALAVKLLEMLEGHATAAAAALRQRARQHAQGYGLQAGLVGYERLVLGSTQADPFAQQGPGWADGSAPASALPSVPAHLASADAASPIERLTAADAQLLELLAAGHSTQAIARLRHRSPATVLNQLSALYQKLGVSGRAEALEKAQALARTVRSEGGRENPLVLTPPPNAMTSIVTPS